MLFPDKSKKIQQENFRSYSDLRNWMSTQGFKNQGYVLEEPWRSYFVEKWTKNNLIALSVDVSFLPNYMSLPIQILEKPYQVDIAEQ